MDHSHAGLKRYPTIGVCGLDCGMCPRYYTNGPSRCPGCAGPGFFDKHPSCSFITCGVKKRGLETCAECSEFPCPKFKRQEEYEQLKESSSYPPYRRVLSNLCEIREQGVEAYIKRQGKRIELLGTMLSDFDDGRSKSFFCRAAALLDAGSLKASIDHAVRKIKEENIRSNDSKSKAKVLREILDGKMSESRSSRCF